MLFPTYHFLKLIFVSSCKQTIGLPRQGLDLASPASRKGRPTLVASFC